MKPNSWFANKGQLGQFVFAGIGCLFVVVKAVPEMQKNGFFSIQAAIVYVLVFLLGLALWLKKSPSVTVLALCATIAAATFWLQDQFVVKPRDSQIAEDTIALNQRDSQIAKDTQTLKQRDSQIESMQKQIDELKSKPRPDASGTTKPTKGVPAPQITEQKASENSANIAGNNNQVTINPAPAKAALDEKILLQIAKYVQGGAEIQSRFIQSNDVPVLVNQRREWIATVTAYLNANIGEAASIQFGNARGSGSMGCPVNRQIDGCGPWQDIQGKKDFLANIR